MPNNKFYTIYPHFSFPTETSQRSLEVAFSVAWNKWEKKPCWQTYVNFVLAFFFYTQLLTNCAQVTVVLKENSSNVYTETLMYELKNQSETFKVKHLYKRTAIQFFDRNCYVRLKDLLFDLWMWGFKCGKYDIYLNL